MEDKKLSSRLLVSLDSPPDLVRIDELVSQVPGASRHFVGRLAAVRGLADLKEEDVKDALRLRYRKQRHG